MLTRHFMDLLKKYNEVPAPDLMVRMNDDEGMQIRYDRDLRAAMDNIGTWHVAQNIKAPEGMSHTPLQAGIDYSEIQAHINDNLPPLPKVIMPTKCYNADVFTGWEPALLEDDPAHETNRIGAIKIYNDCAPDGTPAERTKVWEALSCRGAATMMYGAEPAESESDRISRITRGMCK